MRDMSLSAVYAAILVFALYSNSDAVVDLYRRPEILWAICPLLLYWISRIVMITHRGWMEDDPIVYAARDRNSIVVVVLAALVILAAGPV